MRLSFRFVLLIVGGIVLTACGMIYGRPALFDNRPPLLEGPPNAENGGWIYYRATSARGTAISYLGGPSFGGMMMGGNNLTCAACHGPSGRGGVHTMHMQVMDAPNITYAALNGEVEAHNGEEGHNDEHSSEIAYSLEDFRRAVIYGKHPDGEPLDRDMPRWQMSDEDLADLFEFLKILP